MQPGSRRELWGEFGNDCIAAGPPAKTKQLPGPELWPRRAQQAEQPPFPRLGIGDRSETPNAQ
eukprot:9915858-Alexandrium_andersonii.AAC.1